MYYVFTRFNSWDNVPGGVKVRASTNDLYHLATWMEDKQNPFDVIFILFRRGGWIMSHNL